VSHDHNILTPSLESYFTIPSNWVWKRLKYLSEIKKGRIADIDENKSEISSLPYLSMEYLRGLSEPQYVRVDENSVLANDGDILLLWDGSNAGEFIKAKKGVVSSTLAKLYIHAINEKYLFFSLKASENFIKSQNTGMGIPHVNGDFLLSVPIPIPSLERQQTIADYLDNETFRIDALISAKEKLIKLFTVKRNSLIVNSVCRGLNTQVKLKNSGFDWLGNIPDHWSVERSKWLLTERNERTENDDGELLTVSHITGVTPRADKEVNMFKAETTEGYKICRKGDLVINTMWAWMGAMGISAVDGIVSPGYNVYIVGSRMFEEYINYLVKIKNFCTEIIRYSKGVWSSRLRLYPEGLFMIYFPVPPLYEQKEIVNYLNMETAKVNSLINATEKSIEILRERRSAIITAAVTGKIK
jgi:type I restriction enzyme S subunit